jgi:hypothetical protein
MAHEFYVRNHQHYLPGSTSPYYDLEPHVALAHFHTLLATTNVTLVAGSPVESVDKVGSVLKSLTTVAGQTYHSTVFIDAGYEGDLMVCGQAVPISRFCVHDANPPAYLSGGYQPQRGLPAFTPPLFHLLCTAVPATH